MTDQARLGDVAAAYRGISFGAGDAAATAFPGSIPCLTTAAVKRQLDWSSARHIPVHLVRDPALFVRPGDVLVSTTNSREKVGSSAPIKGMLDRSTFGAFVTIVRPGSRVLPDYLAHWMRSPQFFDQARVHIRQTTGFANLNSSDLLSIAIPVPALDEQRRIAARLTSQIAAADLLRERASKTLDELVALRVGLLRAELGLPASAESVGSTSTWPITRLGDVAHIQLGKMLSPKAKVGTRPVPYLRNANVQWDRIDVTDVYTMDFSESEEAKFSLVLGDLLVCEGGEPGRAAIWHGELARCCYQKALHRIKPKGGKLDPEFLLHRLRLGGLTGEFLSSHAKTTIAHLPAIRLAELPLALPTVEEQRRIAVRLSTELSDLGHAEQSVRTEIEAIKAVPASFLREAFGPA